MNVQATVSPMTRLCGWLKGRHLVLFLFFCAGLMVYYLTLRRIDPIWLEKLVRVVQTVAWSGSILLLRSVMYPEEKKTGFWAAEKASVRLGVSFALFLTEIGLCVAVRLFYGG